MKNKIIGSVIAFTALWLGGTAYVSSNTESYVKSYVEKTNKIYEQYGMKLSVEEFEKGFFASNTKMKVDFLEPKLREVISETLKLPIEVKYNIENGPLFFKEGLGFGASRINSSLNIGKYFKDQETFKKIFKDDIILTSKTSVNFSDNASFTGTSNKIVANIEGIKVDVSPLKITGDMNVKSFEGQIKMFIASIVSESEMGSLNAKDIVLDGDITKFYDNGFYLGDFILKLDALSMKGENLPFELEGAKTAIFMNVEENKDKTINMKFKLLGEVGKSKLPKDYETLNKVELAYALNGTKLEGIFAFQDFTKELQTKQQELLLKLNSPSTGELDMKALDELQKFQAKVQDEMMLKMAGLLKKDSTSFVLETKMIDKKDKESTFNINIGYVGDDVLPTTIAELKEKFTKELLDLISLDVDVELDKEYIANLPAQFQQELAAQLQMGKMFGIVKENNNSYSFDAKYKAKILMVNGENRSEMLEMAKMGLSGKKAF